VRRVLWRLIFVAMSRQIFFPFLCKKNAIEEQDAVAISS
jgi:hypothetical protein